MLTHASYISFNSCSDDTAGVESKIDSLMSQCIDDDSDPIVLFYHNGYDHNRLRSSEVEFVTTQLRERSAIDTSLELYGHRLYVQDDVSLDDYQLFTAAAINVVLGCLIQTIPVSGTSCGVRYQLRHY